MGIALILVSLGALCLGIFGWLWLAGGALRGGWRGVTGIAALQASALCLLWGFLGERPLVGLYTALFPPLALFDLASLSAHGAFLTQVLARGAPWAAGVLVLGLLWRSLRPWAPGLGLAALMVAGAILGEGISLRLMCEGAATRGLTDLRRMGLTESLGARGLDGARPPHGRAVAQDGTVWGWSYGSLDWHPLPTDAALGEGLQPADCADLPG